MLYPTDILSTETWILIFTLVFLAWYYVHRKWQYLKKLNIPHDPPSLLQFGHMRNMLGKKMFTMDLENKKKYGPIFGYYMGLYSSIVVFDPDILRHIFIKEFATFPNRRLEDMKISGKELNSSITSIRGKQWKRVRSTLTPNFSTSKLKQMSEMIQWCCGHTIDVLKRKVNEVNGTFDSKELFSRLSLDIICSAAFSTKVHSQDDTKKEPEIVKEAKNLFKVRRAFLVYLLAMIPFTQKLMEKLDISIVSKSSLTYFKNFTEYVIGKRSQEDQTKIRADFLQHLLNSEISEEEAKKEPEKGVTRTELLGNSMVMILAGYENTANAMSLLAYNLAQYPDIQAQVQEEIDEMLKTHGKSDYEGVNSLKLLDMCLNESLRLYNPIIWNQRAAEEEITIKGFTIPAKASILIPTYALSHDPEYWDEPYEFKPERMRDMSAIDPMVYQPFGAGPRNCIGMRFALMEVKMAMCKILQHFTLKPTETTPKPPLEFKYESTLKPVVDIYLRVVPREKET